MVVINNETSIEEIIDGIKSVKNSVNPQWLDHHLMKINSFKPPKGNVKDMEYYRKFHPLAWLIHMSDKNINSIIQHQTKNLNQYPMKLSFLGHKISILIKNKTKGLKLKIQELTSDEDFSLFEKTFYEITVAASLVKLGHTVEFIKTDSKNKIQTPDLLIDSNIEVECTKKDLKSDRDIRNEDERNIIRKKAFDIMDQNRKNACFKLIVNKDLTEILRNTILKKLTELIIQNEDSMFSNKDFELEITFTPNKNIEFESSILFDSSHEELIKNTNRDIIPTYYRYVKSTEILDRIIDKENDFTCSLGNVIRNRIVYVFNLKLMGFKMSNPPDRIKSVIDSISKKKKQLSGSRPGLIYVEMNRNIDNWQTNDFEKLKNRIQKILKNNSKISGVIVTFTKIFNQNGHVGLISTYHFYPNQTAKFPIPENFKISCN